MKKVTLITDGACLGNPGPGGWAAILRFGQHYKELYGPALQTTNNQMELSAVIEGLKALREACEVTIITDSQYVHKGVTEWMPTWKRNGWRTSSKQPVKNQELWQALDGEVSRHRVQWQWVKGHADHVDNIRADKLATEAAKLQIRSAK